MKQSTYSRRSRGRGGSRKGGAPSGNRVIDSTGPDAKVRGNVHQVWEKYLVLARDATASGDRILAEGYYQHAEHYYRLLNANAANGLEAGGRKGKGQSQSSASRGGNGASRDENKAEAEVIPTKTAETAEAEVIPTGASKEASPEGQEEMQNETSDGREALAVFPDTMESEDDDAVKAPDKVPDEPVNAADEDAEEGDSAATK